jgi:acetyl esterase/lipase
MLSPTAIEPAVQRIRDVYAGWSRQTTPARMREDWDRLFRPETVVAAVEQVRIGAVSATWVEGPADRVFLYLPGGGYRVGSSRSHLDIIARIARAGGCAGLGVDYRLAPEHRFPAPIIDALSIYGWLLASDVPPERIAVVGDSAGGNLALALLLALKDRNEPLPACVALLSPWTDLQATGGGAMSHGLTSIRCTGGR